MISLRKKENLNNIFIMRILGIIFVYFNIKKYFDDDILLNI